MDINSLISLANSKLICGPECKKEEKSIELKKIYDDTKKNLFNAPSKYKQAEKNYLIHDKGEDEYINIMRERKIKTVNIMKKKLLEKHNEYINDIRGYNNQYNTDFIYYNRINDFYESSLKDNKKYKKEIEDYNSDMNVNNRKVFYRNQDIERLSFMRIILLIVYFIILIIILYKVDFINNEYYKNKYILLGILIYILFGIYVDKLSIMMFNIRKKIYYLFENEAPRNVYVEI